ncbi:MAG: hypothetical protein HY736_08200 [Verrucomicrobia bacterium]|nr:hypothetical protein [Verrucomicrobiota bacterium]
MLSLREWRAAAVFKPAGFSPSELLKNSHPGRKDFVRDFFETRNPLHDVAAEGGGRAHVVKVEVEAHGLVA